MEDIPIDFIKELLEYDDVFAHMAQAKGVENVRGDIVAFLKNLAQNPDEIYKFERLMTDIRQSKQKIAEQNEKIRARLATYPASNAEYDEIMADADPTRRGQHVERFLTERINEIHGVRLQSGNLDKRVHRLNQPEEMLEMRKDLYVERKDIAEALSLLCIENSEIQKSIRLLLEKKATEEGRSGDIGEQKEGKGIEILFQNALIHMVRTLLLIEEYQKDGLMGIRHLEELDRQVVYMLVMLALKKHK